MNRIETKSLVTSTNPYRAASPNVDLWGMASSIQNAIYSPIGAGKTAPSLADRVVEWGKSLLFEDYEKQLNFAEQATWFLDKGVVTVVGGMQGAVIVEGLFHLHFLEGRLSILPQLVKTILLPSSIFFFIMGIIEMIFELINLKRGIDLLHGVSKESSPLDTLGWMKEHYFTLQVHEAQKIYNFIEKKLPDLSTSQKADRFDQIAERALEVRFESLKRRITPGLADEVKLQLDSITKDLKSSKENIRVDAATRAKLLMESVSTQAKNKIKIHLLGILSICFTLISMIGIFAGIGVLPFFIALGAGTAITFVTKLIIQKGHYERSVERFYDQLSKFTVPHKGGTSVSYLE